jgi:parallel beta-helix repeat protein
MYLSRACWRQPDWLWEKGLGSEPTSWRQSYIERFVMLGGKQRDFGHALADEEVSQANRDGRLSFDAADRLKQEGVLRTQVALRRARMHRVRAYGFNADVGAPAPTSGGNRVYHVEWAKGSLGMRTARCTLTQMIEQMHPGETLAFEPGVYRTDAPVRVYKAIELVRHPDYGAAVGPASTIVDSVVPFAGTSHASASYAFGYSNNRAPTEFGPRAAGAVVIEAPLVAFGGGVSHAGWNGGGGGRGGGRGGSDSSGGVGGGLGRVAGVTLSCSHVSFSGHSRVLFEDVQFAGHVACFEGSAPRIMYSKLQSLSCTDQSAPEVRSCRVLYALSDASTLTALKNDGLERLGVRWGGESRGVLAGCEVTGFPEGMAALEIEHDSGCEVHRNAIHGNRGAGVRVSSRAWVKLEANEIHGNKQAGLVVDGDAPPRVTGNTLHGNGGGGIVIKGSARGTYADNTVFACGQSGIAIADVAAPTLVNNRVHGNQGAGVAIGGKAQGTAQGNSVVGNTGPGVTVSAYAQTVLEENNIHANGQSGVMVWGHARPTFLRNSIHDNAAAGVVMGEDCACTFSRNSVFGNATVGMVIGDAARGVVADNDVYENNVGVAIKGDASPEFHSNNLRNNKEGGLEAPDERVGTYMQSNHCYKNNTAAGEDNCVIM